MDLIKRRNLVVELATTERFSRAWALLDAPDEINRIPAFNGIRRMLASRGLKMDDLLEAMRSLKPLTSDSAARSSPKSPWPTGAQAQKAQRTYAAMDEMVRKDTPGGRMSFLRSVAEDLISTTFIASRGLRHVSGAKVPSEVIGPVEIAGLRHTPFGKVLAVVIRDRHNVYGPMIAFDPAEIERLNTGADTGSKMRILSDPGSGTQAFPTVRRVSVYLG